MSRVTQAPVTDEAGFEVLSTSECLRLLERGGLGQVTLPGGDEAPTVRTVNFVLDATQPTVTIDQAVGQSDPTATTPIAVRTVDPVLMRA